MNIYLILSTILSFIIFKLYRTGSTEVLYFRSGMGRRGEEVIWPYSQGYIWIKVLQLICSAFCKQQSAHRGLWAQGSLFLWEHVHARPSVSAAAAFPPAVAEWGPWLQSWSDLWPFTGRFDPDLRCVWGQELVNSNSEVEIHQRLRNRHS